MATFRSDFNSVPNTYGFTVLKNHLTTCFQKLRQKLSQKLQLDPATTERHQRHRQLYRLLLNAEYSIVGKKTKFQKLKEIFVTRKYSAGHHQQNTDDQLQIVAGLLSSTLIENSSTYSSSSIRREELFIFNSRMTISQSRYETVRDEYPEIDKEIRAILMANAQNGITISNIKKEYLKLTGIEFPFVDNVTDFLLTIPMVTAECNENGTRFFNLKPNNKNKHLHEMVLNQRQRTDYNHNNSGSASVVSFQQMKQIPPAPRLWRANYKRRALDNINMNLNIIDKPSQPVKAQLQQLTPIPTDPPPAVHPISPIGIPGGTVEHNWCYQDNWNHLNNRYQQAQVPQIDVENIYCDALDPLATQHPLIKQQKYRISPLLNGLKRKHDFTPTTISANTEASDSVLTIKSDYDAYLLDFPLLGDDFFMYLARMELKCRFRKHEKVLQSGLCVSGQTIKAARRRLRSVQLNENTQIIVNIGSVDIMKGKPLVQIEHDFRQLLNDMHKRRFVAVLTTLAPLANYCHDKGICEKVLRFNNFIRNEGRYTTVIDIHQCLVNEKGIVRFDCYQNGPRSVTGSSEPYVFWNKIGRQRVLQMIEAKLEY
ncbi:maternal effect protein oskar [Scaptodrosophila lebanonensis]|uniref:Maternal effect protein oskar n=1 Tax=Drosophila lebanonensis TaxID=7225 RepID=A0A6J2TDK2_DROLE|nr:maternal effect protein oskar [Scaptodrosophila lebanonensis]